MGIERTPESKPENGSPAGTSGVPEGTGERRGRRSPLTVALVAGAVLVAGGGSAYWAASAASGAPGPAAPAAGTNPAPLALSGWGQGTAAAPGVRYQATGALPAGPGSASVYQARGDVSRDDVAKLASALGVSGPVTLDHGVWRAAPDHNAPGPTLQVTQQAPGSWAFARNGVGTGCHPSTANGGGVSGTAGHAVCYSPEDAMRSTAPAAPSPGPAVPPDQARRAVAPVLTALGLDGGQVDAAQTVGGVRTVTVDPVVGGLPTHGWQTALQVGPDGRLLSGSGRLAALARGTTYPVVSARRALDEVNGSGAAPGTGPCHFMHPGATGLAGADPGGPADPGDLPVRPPARCVTGSPLTLDVRTARFGLSAQFVGGRSELVPSWLFQVAQPEARQPVEIAQPAVDPKYIVPPPGAAPSPGSAVHIESYAAEGRTLTVRFWGGVCSTYSASVVSQSADAVTARITSSAKDPRRICVMLAKSVSERVTLDAPLGSRTVHDASDGRVVPRRG